MAFPEEKKQKGCNWKPEKHFSGRNMGEGYVENEESPTTGREMQKGNIWLCDRNVITLGYPFQYLC